jgi:hypothetical protein
MGLLLTLLLLFLVAGVGTAVRQHGWAQGVRRYGAGLAGLGAGAAQAVGFAGDTSTDSRGAGELDQEGGVSDTLSDMMDPIPNGEGRCLNSAADYFGDPHHTYDDIEEIRLDPTHPWYSFYHEDD